MHTSYLDPIALTCERIGDGWLAEPLNLLACPVFFICAWLLWKDYLATRKAFDEERVGLIVLITLIGLGNAFFHATSNRISLYAAFLPMAIFMAFILFVSLSRLLGLAMMPARLLLVVLAVFSWLTRYIPGPYRLNDSVVYIPFMGAFALVAWGLYRMRYAAVTDFLKITALLAAALFFRSMDMAACQWLPTGTFFLWHICNGLALYLMVRVIRERRKADR